MSDTKTNMSVADVTNVQQPRGSGKADEMAVARGKRPRDDVAPPQGNTNSSTKRARKPRQPSTLVLTTGDGSAPAGTGKPSQQKPNGPVVIGSKRLGGIDATLWKKDPIYRLVREIPRSDMVHFIKCKLSNASGGGGKQDITKANRYMEENLLLSEAAVADGIGGLKDIRLQLGAPWLNGINVLRPNVLGGCRYTLKKLDLSRNLLQCSSSSPSVFSSEDDNREDGAVAGLIDALDLRNTSGRSQLEVLDLSHNTQLGNAGASMLLDATKNNSALKALLLKHTGINSEGCTAISTYLRLRVEPRGNDNSHSSLGATTTAADAASQEQAEEASDEDGGTVETPVPQGSGPRKSKRDMRAAQKAAGTAAGSASGSGSFSGSSNAFGLPMFFLNLNENLIGSAGLKVIGKGLPDYVSLSVVGQQMSKSMLLAAAKSFKAAPPTFVGSNIITPVPKVVEVVEVQAETGHTEGDEPTTEGEPLTTILLSADEGDEAQLRIRIPRPSRGTEDTKSVNSL